MENELSYSGYITELCWGWILLINTHIFTYFEIVSVDVGREEIFFIL